MNSETYASLPDETKRALGSNFVIEETLPTGVVEIRRPNKRPVRVSASKLMRHLRKASSRQRDRDYLERRQAHADH